MKRKKVAAVFFVMVVLFFLFFLLRKHLLCAMGSFVIQEDPLEKTDAIVILNGAFPRDVLGAAQIYQKKLASKVIMARERLPDGFHELIKRKIQVPDMAKVKVSALEQLGVHKNAIILLEGDTDGTYQEAMVLLKYIKKDPEIQRITMVTRRAHTKRAKKIFQKVLGNQVKIFVTASEFDPLTSDTWWKDTWHIYEVANEYIKNLYYYLEFILPLSKR